VTGTIHRVALGDALTLLAACTRAADTPPDTAAAAGDTGSTPAASEAFARVETNVRVVNAVPDGPAVDLVTGEHSAFTNVAFRDITTYHTFASERPHIRVVRTGVPDSAVLGEFADFARDGRYYTVIVVGRADGQGAGLQVLRDDDPMRDSTMAGLRLVHVAMNLGSIDMAIEGSDGALFRAWASRPMRRPARWSRGR
jgi:hypothetical protein